MKALEYIKSTAFVQIVKYVLFGILTVFINILIFEFFYWLGIYYLLANILAYFIATAISYFLNKKWVFQIQPVSESKTLLFFFLTRITLLGLENLLLFISVDLLFLSVRYSKIMISFLVITLNYIIVKYIIFKKGEKIYEKIS